jgi:hypothetical protein
VKPHVELTNPSGDADFVALVDREASGAADAGDLQRRLRRTHPDAVVHARGLSGEAIDVWYVYRDGSWTAPLRD